MSTTLDHPPTEAVSATEPRRSTAHYRVDIYRAEILERQFPAFDAVMIRECLEGAPVKQAVALLDWAQRKSPKNPYRALRAWARRNRKGFYRPRRDPDRPGADETYRLYLGYMRHKEEEKRQRDGRVLTTSEIERLTREFYAPEYRAASEVPSNREAG